MDYRQEFLDSIGLDFKVESLDQNLSELDIHKKIYKNNPAVDFKTEQKLYFDLEYNFRFRFQSNEAILDHAEKLYWSGRGNLILDFPRGLSMQAALLDYGCGAAEYSLALCLAGFSNITLAELPNLSFKWLQYIAKKENLSLKFIEIIGENELKEEYDFVTCSEVLEHVWNPVRLLKYLCDHLKFGHYAYLSPFFNDLGGQEPFHLTHNNIYSNNELWNRILNKTGFFLHKNDINNCPKIFEKGTPMETERKFELITEDKIKGLLQDDTFRNFIADMTRVKAQNQDLNNFIDNFIDIYFKK